MNLHALAIGPVSVVNPQQTASVQFSTGAVGPTPDGRLLPAYSAPVLLQAQVQALSGRDLRQVDSLNLQGTLKTIYFFGLVDAIERFSAKGGDLVTFPDPVAGLPAGTVWLTTLVPEAWPDWCHTVCTLQNGS